jgi:hypothetical protein
MCPPKLGKIQGVEQAPHLEPHTHIFAPHICAPAITNPMELVPLQYKQTMQDMWNHFTTMSLLHGSIP